MVFDLSAIARDLEAGAVAPARRALRHRLGDAPADPDALFLAGIAEGLSGGNPLRWHLRCLALAAGHAGAAANAAVQLAAAGAAIPALRCLRRLLALDPAAAVGHGNLGIMLIEADPAAAARAFARILAAFGPDPQTLVNLGAAREKLRRLGEAERAYRQAAAAEPRWPLSLYNLALTAQGRGDVERTLVLLRRVLTGAPDDSFVHSNLLFALTYRADAAGRIVSAEARRWAARHARVAPVGGPPWPNARETGRRLRIGYLSSDLRSHAVSRNLEGLLRHHDHAGFEIVAYSATRNPDPVTGRLKSLVDLWRDVAAFDDRSIAETIRGDGIDILVNVAGHTGHNRARVPAFRPAPVQASLFDLATTGMDQVDHWFTDSALHPGDTREDFVERLERLPALVVHEPPESAPELTPLPALAARGVTFVSCNNPAKLSAETLALWGRILHAVPGARLLLKYSDAFADPLTQARFAALFGGLGIDRSRLVFAPAVLDQAGHLAIVGSADIALDPFPFNGSTTTFEALWMGLPVVALSGSSFLSRMSLATLLHAGLPDLVAPDGDAYVRIAVDLAQDLPRLAALRAAMRPRLAASLLCRPEPYARSVEAAYRRMWEAWCRADSTG